MSGYIKYFNDNEKNIEDEDECFKIEDESVSLKYNEIWNKIKKTLSTRSHSQPIYDEKYIKVKVKTFDGVINSLFSTINLQKKEIVTFVLQHLESTQKKLSSDLSRTM